MGQLSQNDIIILMAVFAFVCGPLVLLNVLAITKSADLTSQQKNQRIMLTGLLEMALVGIILAVLFFTNF